MNQQGQRKQVKKCFNFKRQKARVKWLLDMRKVKLGRQRKAEKHSDLYRKAF